MKVIFAVIALLPALYVRAVESECYGIDIASILPIGYQLATESREGSYTTFIFEESGDFTSEDQLNIQFSIEDGKLGLDWVLKTPRNIKDAEKFRRYAEANGYVVVEKKVNGVEYYRIETGGSLFALCKKVITELYSIPEEDEICLIYSGVEFEVQ